MTQLLPAVGVPRLTTVAILLLALCACATAPAKNVALVIGQQAALEGEVVQVDTAPWAYDGNAVVTILTSAGRVGVQLPARWNLCQAPPLADVQGLMAGDRVQVIGTVTAAGEVVVCAQPQHRLSKID